MRKRRSIVVFLLFSASIMLTTCQLQFNQFNQPKGLNLRILGAIGGAWSTLSPGASAKDISGGTSVEVTIQTQGGATWASTGPTPTGGKTSVDFTFTLPPPGSYQASAQLLDGSGNLLSQAGPASFTIPTQTNPVVLTMSPNLLNAVFAASSATSVPPAFAFVPSFVPTTYTYTSVTSSGGEPSYLYPTYTLTVTTVDPNAKVSMVETDSYLGNITLVPAGSPSGSVGTLQFDTPPETITVVVTSADGTATQTYTMTVPYNAG
jgi:hypothetical protein